MTTAEDRLRQEALEAREVFPRRSDRITDITADFISASNQLQPGQLIKDEWFTLFEAVGALEIMDPKMDSGYVPPDDTFEPDFDPAAPLTLEEILWIIDQILCLEIMWHDGYPLSQTVFTSLHIHHLLDHKQGRIPSLYGPGGLAPRDLTDLQSLGHDLLTAYCVATIKCCERAMERVQSQTFYEEEDFVTHCFGQEFLTRLTANEATGMLEDVTTRLQRADGVTDDIKVAVGERLKMRHNLLTAVAGDVGQDPWEEMLVSMGSIKESHALATPLPEAFSEKIQRQLATSTPPRPMLTTSWDTACAKWTRLCSDVLSAWHFMKMDIIQSPASLYRAVWAFSASSRSKGGKEPFPLARAVMQGLLFADGAVRGQVQHYDLILADIRESVLAGDAVADPASFEVEVPTDPRHICARLIENFIEKAGDEYLNLYRMVCQNRCRIRRTFTQAIPIFDALMSEASSFDLELGHHAPSLSMRDSQRKKAVQLDPLTSWTRFHKLRLMAWTVQLGFETEIYLSHELAGTYWFLSFICQQQTALIEHILRFTQERTKRASNQNTLTDCLLAEEYLRSLHSWSEATRLLAEALWKVFTLLKSLDIISTPKREFADRQLLYETRMKPFLPVINSPIPAAVDFEAATQQHASLEETCSEIDDLVKQAKTVLAGLKKLLPEQGRFVGTEEEWKAEVKGMEASCVATAVGASQIRRAKERAGGEEDTLRNRIEVKVEKRFAEWWPVPVLKER